MQSQTLARRLAACLAWLRPVDPPLGALCKRQRRMRDESLQMRMAFVDCLQARFLVLSLMKARRMRIYPLPVRAPARLAKTRHPRFRRPRR